MYEYILFDLDDTLTDSKPGITRCVQYALHKMGIEEPDLDKLEPFIGPPLLDSFREFYGLDAKQGQQAIVYYRERFNAGGIFENQVYPGVEKLLSDLKNLGKKLAVASSKPQVYVERILEHFGLGSYFDVVVGSGLDGTRTKKEEVVEEALRRLLPEKLFQEMMDEKRRKADGRNLKEYSGEDSENREKHESEMGANVGEKSHRTRYDSVVMVGDRRFDVEGAREYHIVSVGADYGYAAPGELDEAGADVIVKTVKELGDVLR